MSNKRPNREARRKLELQPFNKAQPVANSEQPQCHITFQSVTALIRRALKKWLDYGCTGMKYGWRVVTGLVPVLGAIALLFDYSPKISVSTEQPLNPSNAFTAPFIVGLDGYLPIFKVSSTCVVNISMENRINFRDIALGGGNDIADKMLPGERLSAKCRFQEAVITPAKLIRADIRIVIKYKSCLAWHLGLNEAEKEFRFVSVAKSDGSWHWLPQPIGK